MNKLPLFRQKLKIFLLIFLLTSIFIPPTFATKTYTITDDFDDTSLISTYTNLTITNSYVKLSTNKNQGILYSTNLFNSTKNNGFKFFVYNCSLSSPQNSTLKLQFSHDNQTWFAANGTANKWSILNSGVYTLQLNLGWSGDLYYRMRFERDNSTYSSPILCEVSINYEGVEQNVNLLAATITGLLIFTPIIIVSVILIGRRR